MQHGKYKDSAKPGRLKNQSANKTSRPILFAGTLNLHARWTQIHPGNFGQKEPRLLQALKIVQMHRLCESAPTAYGEIGAVFTAFSPISIRLADSRRRERPDCSRSNRRRSRGRDGRRRRDCPFRYRFFGNHFFGDGFPRDCLLGHRLFRYRLFRYRFSGNRFFGDGFPRDCLLGYRPFRDRLLGYRFFGNRFFGDGFPCDCFFGYRPFRYRLLGYRFLATAFLATGFFAAGFFTAGLAFFAATISTSLRYES